MFICVSTDDGRQLPTEYLPCSAIQPKYGMCMYMSSGKLAVAATTNKAQYVCVREEDAAVSAGDIIPVVKIQPDQVWETTGSGNETIGVGYDVKAGGLELASTTNTANFIVNAKSGTKVRGRFVL